MGCRRHELLYAQPRNAKKIREFDEESDAYTNIDDDSDPYVEPLDSSSLQPIKVLATSSKEA